MKYNIINKQRVFDGFLKIDEFKISHDTFNAGGIEKSIEVLNKGDACAALIFERDTRNLLFINQFRLPTAEKDKGWIIELVAGSVEENESPADTMLREIEEEIGYRIKSTEPIAMFYVSPGWTSERIFLFYAETESTEKIQPGGGKKEEGEDIQLIKFPADEITKMIPEIIDAKTLIAVQWFLLNKNMI